MEGEKEEEVKEFADLPLLCLDIIAKYMVDIGCDLSVAIANKFMTENLAQRFYEHIDQKSTEHFKNAIDLMTRGKKELLDLREKENKEKEKGTLTTDLKTSEIKEACKAIGSTLSGTKEQLIAAYEKKRSEDENERQATLIDIEDILWRVEEIEKRHFICPVRSNARLLYKALLFEKRAAASGTKDKERNKVTVTHAKCLGATEKMLSNLDVEYKRNPMYRGASPMRLYSYVEVAKSILQENGPGTLTTPIIDPIEMLNVRKAVRAKDLKRHKSRLAKESLADSIILELVVGKEQVNEFTQDHFAFSLRNEFVKGKLTRPAFEVKVIDLNAKIQRRSQLAKALKEHNLEVRSDSRLCADYINQSLVHQGNQGHGKSLEDIVTVMVEMDFYYKHTEYPKILNNLFEGRRRQRERNYERNRFYGYNDYDDYYDDDTDSDDSYSYEDRKINDSEYAKTEALKRFKLKWFPSETKKEKENENKASSSASSSSATSKEEMPTVPQSIMAKLSK